MPAKKATPKNSPKKEIPINKRLVPSSEKRVHKQVARYSDLGESSKVSKPIVIKKGKGKKFSKLEAVATYLSKHPKSDPTLRTLHGLLIGRVNKSINIKENLGQFSGIVYDEDLDRQKMENKLEKHPISELRDFLDVFGLERHGRTKEELVTQITDYLEKPSGEPATTPAPKKRKRSQSPAKSRSQSPAKSSSRKSSKSPTKKTTKKTKKEKDPNAPKRPLSAYMYFSKDKREELTKKNGKESVAESSKKIAALWKKATSDEKKKYDTKAAKDKTRYEKEMAEYKKKEK
jgi:hypothetical protein